MFPYLEPASSYRTWNVHLSDLVGLRMHTQEKLFLLVVTFWSYTFVQGDYCTKDDKSCQEEEPSEKYANKVNLVQQQFEAYPSPEFTEDDMEREVDWYKKFKNGTLDHSRVVQHAMLEHINHFLFKVFMLSY